jgi:tetratricopeptide (TPR) repeat protein
VVDPTRFGDGTLDPGDSSSTSARPSSSSDAAPARVGRYVILAQIGRGGMGIVYAAYDPELDRKIAIKLIDPRRDDVVNRTRLLREAQAMAKLQHPNVVAVHDVGVFDERVFVAMEFVCGRTLSRYLAERARPWREIVAAFIEAGRGLAAAHDEGLVHRDFKPDNVLVADVGRIQVTDFGLARAPDLDGGSDPFVVEPLPASVKPGISLPLTKITATGVLMGTPAYMAPEQHAGRSTDARTDQFSFCVALYEALYGTRPFAGATLPELAEAVLEGRVQPIPRAARVPQWLGRVVLRGLACAPQRRWPSMSALIAQLDRDPGRNRMRMAGALAAGSLLAGSVALARSGSESGPECQDHGALLEGTWNASRRAAAGEAFTATGVRYAEDTWARVEPLLDGYAERWADTHVRACVAHSRREVSDELYDRKIACLRQRRSELDALVEVLVDADAATVQNAVAATDELADVTACEDDDALWAEVDPPVETEVAERVGDLRARLAGARATANAGRVQDARAVIEAVAREAEGLGYRPLLAEARGALGWIQDRSASYGEAEAALLSAWTDAVATGHERVAGEAAADLVLVVGVRQARVDEGLWWARYAQALVERRAHDEGLAARFRANLGNLHRTRGDHVRAIEELRAVVEIEERTKGHESPEAARQISALGLALLRGGDHTAAHAELTRALEIQTRALGPEHPEVATSLNNLGVLLSRQGRYRDARAEHERALRIRLDVLGPEHPDTASSHTNLGGALRHLGEWELAQAHLRRAVEIKAKALGPGDPQVADALTNLGNVYFAQDDFRAAAHEYRRAHEIYLAALGPEHADVAAALNNLGTVAWKQGELDQAESYLARAIEVWERAPAPNRPDLAAAFLGLGEVALARKRQAQARERLERALALVGDAGSEHELLARVRLTLARAIVQQDPARAAALAAEAAATFTKLGAGQATSLDAVKSFIAEHPELRGSATVNPL